MAAAAPPKPWKAEYAKSSRSSCKTCKSSIGMERLRLGRMVAATQFDGFMPMWHHAECIFKKANQIKSVDDVEGIDLMRWEDQQRIRKYVEGGSTKTSLDALPNECAIEVSQTSRASCKHCGKKIDKGNVRVAPKSSKPGSKSLAWHHLKCFLTLFPSTQFQKLSGWDSLSEEDKEHVGNLANQINHSDRTKGEDALQKGDVSQGHSAKGSKRKSVASDEQKQKIARPEPNISSPIPCPPDLDKKLEDQSKDLWAVKDELKKHVTSTEMREMLEVNDQDSTGSEFDLRDRCVDGMLFGALGRCPICSGFLHYIGGRYVCHGYVSAWSKCSYSTTEPVRHKGKWKIPTEAENKYLVNWFKSQKVKKPARILPPSVLKAIQNDTAVNNKNLEDLKIAFNGLEKDSMNEWKNKVEGAGGTIHPKVKKDTHCLVVGGDVGDEVSEIKKARRMKVPIVREGYLVDCFRRHMILPVDQYKVESVAEPARGGIIKVKVKGQSAVHEASGLQDTCHILQDKTTIYNTTLNMSDLSTGINSYYILQIIEEDKGVDCYIFRKWGRVGNDKIGGKKLEELPKADAIQEFKRLFREKTGNSWEAWETKQNFQKQPGRFFPLEIDYGVKNQAIKKKDYGTSTSRLSPPLLELVKMLFDVETYRAAMMEFEINMSEMPLGKLSKSNIRQGFEALTEIQNLLNSSIIDQSIKESLIVDASNRFFTVIPSIHPHIIRDEDEFKSKVKMLEALQDIEIASKLVDFDSENVDSLDDKYEKLQCDISPLSRDSEDYRLVEKYLMTTHAPTHKEWSLELEEVFSLERKGEADKFDPYREKHGNRMLLWHGSRLSNFVGILSQGLRIAPPEAPATGYMFGKGIYFADLVSKSAQYCYTDKKSPVGLMLLSEVALGEVYELKNAKYMDKPPDGKHSTKGLGKHIPKKSEYVKWRDQVTVPCGSPISSSIQSSELMYNEYIVYNTAQVKMQFLLKVRFHHKR